MECKFCIVLDIHVWCWSFILTIWNVNLNRLIGSINYNDRFILTIWNVNSFSNAFFTYGANVLY
ncbi:putative membrane protein [Clostridioides difficile DA00203]|nr:putative membrane protein [Clostridioides difficile CD132]EQH14200.1 putative membrane protein [Clostridioides difficile DA00203]EQI69959.1 putative membrane protein [Clostridioides difficile Y358]EQI85177.1 putative membrane protein [Clostridioides difficile P2]EQJ30986.1 putative membrane protein [Clostridioides difficile P19]EQJ33895.1 putative membrane protein [Clostridioides difficile P20]